jgi:hypothetical protein
VILDPPGSSIHLDVAIRSFGSIEHRISQEICALRSNNRPEVTND